jgi:hypothetical protein
MLLASVLGNNYKEPAKLSAIARDAPALATQRPRCRICVNLARQGLGRARDARAPRAELIGRALDATRLAIRGIG